MTVAAPRSNPTIQGLLAGRPQEGDLANPEGRGEVASMDGDMIRLGLRVSKDGVIQAGRYRTMGSELLIPVMETILSSVIGMRLDASAQITWTYVADRLSDDAAPFPPEEVHRIPLGIDALTTAVRDFLDKAGRPPEIDLLLCRCLGVTEGAVRRAIEAGALRTIEEVGDACDAGLGCSSCHPDIQQMLDLYWAKREAKETAA